MTDKTIYDYLINTFGNSKVWLNDRFCIKGIETSDRKISIKHNGCEIHNSLVEERSGQPIEVLNLNTSIDTISILNPKALYEECNILCVDDDSKFNEYNLLEKQRNKLLKLVNDGIIANVRSKSGKLGHFFIKISDKSKIDAINITGTNYKKENIDLSYKMKSLFSIYVSKRNITYYNQYLNIKQMNVYNKEAEYAIIDYLTELNRIHSNKDVSIKTNNVVTNTTKNSNEIIEIEYSEEYEKKNYIDFITKGLKKFTLDLFKNTNYEADLYAKDSIDDYFNGFKSFMLLVYKHCGKFINREDADNMIEIIREVYDIKGFFNLDMVNNQFIDSIEDTVKELKEKYGNYKVSKDKDESVLCYGKNLDDGKYYILYNNNGYIIEEMYNFTDMCEKLNTKGYYTDIKSTKYESFVKLCFDWRKFSNTPITKISIGKLRQKYDEFDICSCIPRDISMYGDDVIIVNEFDYKIINTRLNRSNYENNTIENIKFNDLSVILQKNLLNIFKSDIYGDDFTIEAGIHLLAGHFVLNRKSDYMFSFIDNGGFGKDTFMQVIKKIYGSQWYKWELEKTVYFNKNIDYKSIIYIEEGKLSNSDYWKQILTSMDISLNFKYEDSREVDFSSKQFFMSTNSINNIKSIVCNDNSIRAGSRRLFICMSDNKEVLDDNLLIDTKDNHMMKDICMQLSKYLYSYVSNYSGNKDAYINKCKEYENKIREMNVEYFSSTDDTFNVNISNDIIDSINTFHNNNIGNTVTMKDILDYIKIKNNVSRKDITDIKDYIICKYNIENIRFSDRNNPDRILININDILIF